MRKKALELTPKQIVKELDQYIIGQKEAKRAVAIALRNRWRRRNVEDDMRDEILPNNILMIGSTGVGKTEIARRLARLSGAPFVKVEASKYTEVGYVGRDVEGIIRDLVEVAVSNVRNEFTADVEDIAENNVEERLLDLLLPPIPAKKNTVKKKTALDDILNSAMDMMKVERVEGKNADEDDVETEAEVVEEPEPTDDGIARASRTREKFRAKLRAGLLEDYEVEIKTSDRSGGGIMQVFGPMGIEEMGINLQEMMGPMMPSKKKKRKVTVGEARNLLIGEEIDRLLDMDAVITEAMRRTEEMGIVFIDEVDKIVGGDGENGSGPDVSREGVQRDILPIVEGTRVTTKYGPIRTDHILFIAAGAFHVSRPADMIPELQGRFPIRVELDNLGKKEFLRILKEPKNALTKQYEALFATENVELEFEKDALKEIAAVAEEINETMENIGARRLQTVMTTILEDELFKVPSRSIKKVVIDRKRVQETMQNLFEDEDLSRYIL